VALEGAAGGSEGTEVGPKADDWAAARFAAWRAADLVILGDIRSARCGWKMARASCHELKHQPWGMRNEDNSRAEAMMVVRERKEFPGSTWAALFASR